MPVRDASPPQPIREVLVLILRVVSFWWEDALQDDMRKRRGARDRVAEALGPGHDGEVDFAAGTAEVAGVDGWFVIDGLRGDVDRALREGVLVYLQEGRVFLARHGGVEGAPVADVEDELDVAEMGGGEFAEQDLVAEPFWGSRGYGAGGVGGEVGGRDEVREWHVT